MLLQESPPPRLPTSTTPTPPPYVSLNDPPVGPSPGRSTCYAFRTRHCPSHLRPFFTSEPTWCISRGSPQQHISHQYVHRLHMCTQLVHLSEGGHGTPLYTGSAQAASGRFLQAYPVGASPGRGPCHTSIYPQCPGRLRPSLNCASSWCISREEQLPHLYISSAPRPPPTSAPTWCISREGPLPRLHSSAAPSSLRPSPTGAPS